MEFLNLSDSIATSYIRPCIAYAFVGNDYLYLYTLKYCYLYW